MSKTKPAAAGAFAAATAALGAGVDAIFDQDGPLVSELMLDMIDVSEQVRSEFEDEDNTLKELAESIAAHGILQPILVRPRGHRYQLVAGERRYRASRLAGKPSIPAYIREISDAEFEDMQFAENIQRKNLTQLEQARRLQRDYEALGGNLGKLAAKHNKGKPWLSKMLGLLELPEQAARMIGENISADVDLINTVKQVEKADKQAAKDLVDQLKATRGQTDARATARAARDAVKPVKQGTSKGQTPTVATARSRDHEAPGVVSHAQANRVLDKVWSQIERGREAETILAALNAMETEVLTARSRAEFNRARKQPEGLPRAIVEGLRDGTFAASGRGAVVLGAFLLGAVSATGRDFRLDKVLNCVRA